MGVMNEEDIIKIINNGEINAYSQLVERYQTGLIIYCENIVKQRQAGEDIAQEAFIKAFYALPKYSQSKGSYSTWLYRIAANLAIDYLRKHKNKGNISLIGEMAADHDALSVSEKREVQEKVLNLQPPEYSKVVQAYFWEGKKYEEIAAEMEVPIGTISTWMNRAKQLLRKELV